MSSLYSLLRNLCLFVSLNGGEGGMQHYSGNKIFAIPKHEFRV